MWLNEMFNLGHLNSEGYSKIAVYVLDPTESLML